MLKGREITSPNIVEIISPNIVRAKLSCSLVERSKAAVVVCKDRES